MRLFAPRVGATELNGFDGSDIFELKSLAEGLINLLHQCEDPLVIALDGKWGTGKTVFLHQLKGRLGSSGPVIYFDAFENDYVEDAFSALARELVEFIDENRTAGSTLGNKLVGQTKKVGRLLLRGGLSLGARLAVRLATAGTSGVGEFEAAAEDAEKAIGDAAAQYIDEMLTEPNLQKLAIEEFRKDLSNLPGQIAATKDDKTVRPLVFIIDELDRCRPTFALAIIERIKHFMSVPNVHFVLGVNLEQMQNSVRAAYGPNVDAMTYLQKFIGLTIMFNESGHNSGGSKIERYVQHLSSALQFKREDLQLVESVGRILVEFSERRALSLRDVDRIYAQLSVCLSFLSPKTMRPVSLVAGLCIMKVLEPEHFALAKRGKLLFEHAFRALFLEKNAAYPEDTFRYFRDEWAYCFGRQLEVLREDELDAEFLGRYRIHSRDEIIPLIANKIVDRLTV